MDVEVDLDMDQATGDAKSARLLIQRDGMIFLCFKGMVQYSVLCCRASFNGW